MMSTSEVVPRMPFMISFKSNWVGYPNLSQIKNVGPWFIMVVFCVALEKQAMVQVLDGEPSIDSALP